MQTKDLLYLLFLSKHVGLLQWLRWLKSLPIMQETQVQSLGQEDPLEKDMATHSSILGWKNPVDPWGCKESAQLNY